MGLQSAAQQRKESIQANEAGLDVQTSAAGGPTTVCWSQNRRYNYKLGGNHWTVVAKT